MSRRCAPRSSTGTARRLRAEEEGASEATITRLRAIESQVERIERLANDLLIFARTDAGELDVEREDIDLDGTLQAVCEEFRT